MCLIFRDLFAGGLRFPVKRRRRALRDQEQREKNQAGQQVQPERRDVLPDAAVEILVGQAARMQQQPVQRSWQPPVDTELLIDELGEEGAQRGALVFLLLPAPRTKLARIGVVAVRAEGGGAH